MRMGGGTYFVGSLRKSLPLPMDLKTKIQDIPIAIYYHQDRLDPGFVALYYEHSQVYKIRDFLRYKFSIVLLFATNLLLDLSP
jgi:hypothetical protein